MEYEIYDADDVKARNCADFRKKRVEKGGKLLLRRPKAFRAGYDWRPKEEDQKAKLNNLIKQLRTN